MKRASRVRRWLAIVITLVVVFTLLGFFVVPAIARLQLETRLSAKLGRRVTVEKVRMNPYTASVTLENFAVAEKDNAAKFFGWRRLHVNVDPLSSWKEWVVHEIVLEDFDSRVVVNQDSSFNFSDLIAKLAPAETAPKTAPTKPARVVRIGIVHVARAGVNFSDHSRAKPFATTVGPLTFALTEFRTVSEKGSPYRFEAVTESGEKIAWAGTLKAEPPASSGELTLENIILSKYAPYYAERMQADIVDGRLTVRGHYEVSLADGKRMATLRAGAVQLRGLKVVERANQANALELPALDVVGIQADAMTQKASVDSIMLTGGRVRARREKDGSINLLKMLEPPGSAVAQTATPPATASTSPAPAAPAKPAKPDVTIGEFGLKDFQIEIADLAAARPVELALNDIQLTVRTLSLAEGAIMPLQLAFNWAPQGVVRLDGNVAISPMKGDLTVDVATLDLLPISPYLEQFANARITKGAVTAGLVIEASMTEGQPLAASVMGGAKLEKFGLVDGTNNEELAGIGDLTLRGLRASTTPELTVELDEISLGAPSARVVRNKDNTLNLLSVARTEPTPANAPPTPVNAPSTPANATAPEVPANPRVADQDPTPAPSAPAAPTTAGTPLPKIQIGKVVITDGDFRFTDRSVEPNVNMAINQFNGTIAGLSSTNPAKADLDVKAMVDGTSPIAIAGKIDPLGATRTLDVKVDFKNVDLVPLSAYSGKFAGYELARGKLLLDVKINVDGSKIDATNVITLNQFTFGSQVKSAEATTLPVRLGVALLKDKDGKIVLDVPVQGSTDDPSFRIGRVVMRVIVNLLTKAAMSPFSLLGSLIGGGGEELAYQEFKPGSAELQPEEIKKLEKMVKALTSRPALAVNLQGSYEAVEDSYALKQVKLAEAVRLAAAEQKRTANPNTPSPAEIVISAEEEAAMVKKMYDDKFPPGTRFGTPIPPAPAMAPPPAPPQGFMGRLIDSISGQTAREEKAVQEENARRVAEHAKALEAAITTGLPQEEMRRRLAEGTVVDGNDLRALAQARAQSVHDYFTNVGKISPDRLILAKERTEGGKEAKGARVTMELQ